jgi:hypothetical protein
MKRRTHIGLAVLLIVVAVCSYIAWARYKYPFVAGVDKPLTYTMVRERYDTFIYIGVDADISERQLCATLSQAAEDHMNDPSRDMLVANYFRVDAYLLKGDKQSAVPAAMLSRALHPPGRPNLLPNYLTDRFRLSLAEARQTLQ